MKIQINDWEDGMLEGSFETVAEAEAYVLEEGLDVVIYDFNRLSSLSGQAYRFNAEIDAKRKGK